MEGSKVKVAVLGRDEVPMFPEPLAEHILRDVGEERSDPLDVRFGRFAFSGFRVLLRGV